MNTRKNCPRIVEIEDQIQKLVTELEELVQPTDKDREEVMGQIEDFRSEEIMDSLVSTYDLAMLALDFRDEEEDG